MVDVISLLPGVTLRCFRDPRFRQGCLSIQFIRPMCREEAALNALLPQLLLRGSEKYPDLRDITLRLDELYGGSVGALVRRVGDYQAAGFYCGFTDDRFALPGDRILAPMIALVGELLRTPLLENGVFCRELVESEKKNLISAIDAQRNDKRFYAASQLLKNMCRVDSFGIPRLGDRESAAGITPESAFAHYQKLLQESPVEIFYVGSAESGQVAGLLRPVFQGLAKSYINLPAQTPFHGSGSSKETEALDIVQAKLCLGYVTPITIRDRDFAAMQVANTLFGGGMTSKLFMQVRERLSLCYDISSAYHGSKGILTVNAGIDGDMAEAVREEIARQLASCAKGDFTQEELAAAKEAMLSSLRGAHDSPASIEGYYASAALSGLGMTPVEYMEAVRAVTAADAARAAGSLTLRGSYLLKGVSS